MTQRSDSATPIGPMYPTALNCVPCHPCSDHHTDIMLAQNLELTQQSQQQSTKMSPAAIADYSRPTTPEGRPNTNGLASPRTPKASLSLTEYTANPSPPSENPKSKAQDAIPEAFLLPNGYPDVSCHRGGKLREWNLQCG